jgi:glucose/arabinose dehydrogenase/subtilisin-like proprotein convertase family protein
VRVYHGWVAWRRVAIGFSDDIRASRGECHLAAKAKEWIANARRGCQRVVAQAIIVFLSIGGSPGATLPTGFTESTLVSGLSAPTAMEFAPDGRLFICQQSGQLRVVKNGTLLASSFATVSCDVQGERGLLGVAFDPDFQNNNYVYIYYTAKTPALHNRVSRFTANGDVAVSGSETVLLDLNNLSFALNHNGGALHFGADGKLYIAVGDNANGANSQSLGNLLGKVLRLNSDGTIPNDNPFYSTATGVNRAIWAMGFRNPFTFAVQPETGRIFVNDVGENTWEEINELVAGANYGWPNCEGGCSDPAYRNPIYQYAHGTGYCIAGGAFYNPATAQFPSSYIGNYFFADYASGWIRKLDPAAGNQVTSFATGIGSPVDVKVGPDGRLYYLARGNGTVVAIRSAANPLPQITQHPSDQTVRVGEAATFAISSTGATGHQWQRNGLDISGATSLSYTITPASLAEDGNVFRCIASNSSGSVTSNPAILHVSNNNPPTASISAPAQGAVYAAGETILFSGTATDPEDGELAASAFSWMIVFHHDTHTHPFVGPIDGVINGSLAIPTNGEKSANVWYRIHLTVTDSGGRTHTTFTDITPRTATISLATAPPGLQVTLDAQPLTTPVSITSVVGMERTFGVISPQALNGTNYQFSSWSDSGPATHTISSPSESTTYIATFAAQPPSSGPLMFSNSAPITIPNAGSGTPYPSTIAVSGMGGTVENVTVVLKNLTHTWTRDIDALLVSPAGQSVVLMSDAGSGGVNDSTLSFSGTAASVLPSSTALNTGTYRPGNYADSGSDTLPAPAPAPPYGSALSAFNGQPANGSWALYVFDDGAGDLGEFTGGWTLTITTSSSGTPQPPTISDIPNQATSVNTPTAAIPFTVADADTQPGDLVLSKDSSNPTLAPPSNIVFGGSGGNRTVTITPAQGQSGMANITVSVSDGTASASDSFTLTVAASQSTSLAFTNSEAITIPDAGAATPYPSTITVSGMAGTVENVTVVLKNLAHTWTRDIDALLVSPGGQSVVLMSDAGSGGVNNSTLTFSASAASVLPPSASLSTGTYRPANYTDSGSDTLPAPAPAPPYGSAFSVFNGHPANGTWALYVFDDGSGDLGSFAGGWTLALTTSSSGGPQAPTISDIPNQATSVNTPTAGIPFTIGDADTPVENLVLSKGSSNPTLVPLSNIVFGGNGGTRTVTITPAQGQSGTANITVSVSDGTASVSDSFSLTVAASQSTSLAFTNSAAITIPDAGAATPYPSTITVSGMAGTVENVTVVLKNLTHTWTRDIDALLVGPNSQSVLLMSDAGNGGVNNSTLTFSGSAASALPSSATLSTGTYRPANYTDSGSDTLPAPAPAPPYGTALSVFTTQTANGTWALYVFDDGIGDRGSFEGGWTLSLTTSGSGLTQSSLRTDSAPRIMAITPGPEGTVEMKVASGNSPCFLQTSADLVNWTNVLELQFSPDVVSVIQQVTNTMQFFRVLSEPK